MERYKVYFNMYDDETLAEAFMAAIHGGDTYRDVDSLAAESDMAICSAVWLDGKIHLKQLTHFKS